MEKNMNNCDIEIKSVKLVGGHLDGIRFLNGEARKFKADRNVYYEIEGEIYKVIEITELGELICRSNGVYIQ